MYTDLIILNRHIWNRTFMDCRKQEVINIIICSRKLTDLVGNWRRVSERTLSGSDHRQIHFVLKHMEEVKWHHNPRCTNWMGYRENLKAILNKSRFHTLDNLEMTQFINDAIIVAFEVNCPLK